MEGSPGARFFWRIRSRRRQNIENERISYGTTAMTQVRAMCAIGLRGQLGLNGRLPWEGNKEPEYVADVQRFFDMTRGHVLIAGPRTVESVPAWAHAHRTIQAIRSHEKPEDVLARFPGRVVFIGGGPSVWESYAHLISHWDITRLPYDGPADRYLDPAWLVASKG
jgi:dihydromethanopterin reductase